MPTALPAGARLKTTPAARRRVSKTGMVPKEKHPETRMQENLFSYLKHPATLKLYPEMRWIHCSLNGVKLSPVQARLAAAAGMTAGIHDVFWALARGGYNGLYLELKARKNRLTQEQKAYKAFVEAQGYLALEVRDEWLDAKHLILDYYAGRRVREAV